MIGSDELKLKDIREKEKEGRRRGEKTNINTPEMQDLRWRIYGKTRKQLMPAMIEMYDYIINKIGCGGAFLDVGCGEGDLVWRLKDKCMRLVGVDISSVRIWWNMLRALSFAEGNNISFLFSYAENLVFEDGYFDYVTCTATLEHVSKPRAAIDEIIRVLKPGGKAFFGIPVEADPNQPINSPDHYHFWASEKEILGLFHGITVLSIRFINPNLVVEITKDV